MRILMVSWEVPPLVVGGLAAHVHGLSRALAARGHDVTVLTLAHADAPVDSVVDGVRVVRADTTLPWLPEDDFLLKMASANHQLVQLTTRLGDWRPDVVHAHDWLVAWTGDTLRALWDVPLLATIHATERGRNHGVLPPGQPSGINAVEWWLTYQARHVIACSHYMHDEIVESFELPEDKITVVPNGVDAAEWAPPPGVERGSRGPLVVTWGRVQYEKGFQTLLQAMPVLRAKVPGIHAVIAGRGGYLHELQHLAERLGVLDTVTFGGFVPDDELKHLLHLATCAVIPSLYEPFGIVALEALAAGAPLVAAASGGLTEVLTGTDAGLLFTPGDAGDLANAIVRIHAEPGLRRRAQEAGQALVHDVYSWEAVAAATEPVYERVVVSAG
jgi:glycogen(starch) synthase